MACSKPGGRASHFTASACFVSRTDFEPGARSPAAALSNWWTTDDVIGTRIEASETGGVNGAEFERRAGGRRGAGRSRAALWPARGKAATAVSTSVTNSPP